MTDPIIQPGMTQTGAGTFINTANLSDAGRAMAANYATTKAPGTSTPAPTPVIPPDSTTVQTNQDRISAAQSAQDTLTTQNDEAYKRFNDTMQGYVNGSIPLTSGEQAQVDGLKQSYETSIAKQTLANTSAEGVANTRGYQKGSAEYDPTFQRAVIGSIVTAGLNKINDLNVKMSGAIAKLTQSLKDNDIKNIKAAYDEYRNYAKDRTSTLEKSITDAQKSITDYNNAIAKEETTNIKDYNLAKDQGYAGTFEQWKKEQANLKIKTETTNIKPAPGSPPNTTSAEIQHGATLLDQTRGEDGYADPNQYTKMATVWEKAGGTLAAFIKNYPPKTYINPANTTVPSWASTAPKTKVGTTIPVTP